MCLLTLFTLVVLIKLETLKGSTTGYELMGELGFMIWVIVASALSVDLVIGVFRFTLLPTSQCFIHAVMEGQDVPNPNTMIAKCLRGWIVQLRNV